MPAIDVRTFGGEMPKLSPHVLANDEATLARDCIFSNGVLEPMQGAEAVTGVTLAAGHVKSLFLYERNYWFSMSNIAQFVPSPIAQDAHARVYYTDHNGAHVTGNEIATGSGVMPAASYTLGIPAPTDACLAAVATPGTSSEGAADDESRAYRMTYVTGWGEEGPPGPVSNIVTLEAPNGTVMVGLPIPTTNTSNITSKRLYRSVTTGEDTDFYLVGEVALAATGFLDNVETVGQLLDTNDFLAPPANAKGLTAMANGITAYFADNEVGFSVAFLPYAYPQAYRRSLPYKIVGMAAFGTSLAVMTEAFPYVFDGISPDGISETKVELNEACVSQRSIADLGDMVIYASPNGLVAITSNGARLITGDRMLDKKSFAEFSPETIHAYNFQGKYLAFYGDTAGTGAGVGGFVFDPASGTFSRISAYARAGYYDQLTATLYLVIGSGLYKFNVGDDLSMLYRSKEWDIPETSLSCVMVNADDLAQANLKIWADGVLVEQRNGLPARAYRFAGRRATRWQFEVSGTSKIRRVTLATSMRELRVD